MRQMVAGSASSSWQARRRYEAARRPRCFAAYREAERIRMHIGQLTYRVAGSIIGCYLVNKCRHIPGS